MASTAQHLAYRVGQAARVGWFTAHYAAAERLTGPLSLPEGGVIRPDPRRRQAMLRALRDLFEQDWRNVRAGRYAMPAAFFASPLDLLDLSRRFFRDLRAVDARRRRHGHSEVLRPELRGSYPRYYLQNFHYQTDGYLSAESARLYDYQVEILFTGAADAMRRQALVPLGEALKGRDQRRLRLLDVAAGTGRFLTAVKENWPRLQVTALDLSPDYLAAAQRHLAAWSRCGLIQANAEAMPLATASQDVVSVIYLFHELPPKARAAVAAEMARVLKPGGRLIFVDSIQQGDAPDFDPLLEFFPLGFHEPYYSGYTRTDLPALFGAVGLAFESSTPAFFSKVMVFRKESA